MGTRYLETPTGPVAKAMYSTIEKRIGRKENCLPKRIKYTKQTVIKMFQRIFTNNMHKTQNELC